MGYGHYRTYEYMTAPELAYCLYSAYRQGSLNMGAKWAELPEEEKRKWLIVASTAMVKLGRQGL